MITELLRAGEVERYHSTVDVPNQRLAEHHAQVALLLTWLDPNTSPALLRTALVHDAAEIYTGDMPAPVKWEHRSLKKELSAAEYEWWDKQDRFIQPYPLSIRETQLLKLADYLEGAWYCARVAELGARSAARVSRVFLEHLKENPILRTDMFVTARANELIDHIETMLARSA